MNSVQRLIRPAIRPIDVAPYGAALVTVCLLAMMTTVGLRRIAAELPMARSAPTPAEQPVAIAPATKTTTTGSFASSIVRRLRSMAPGTRATLSTSEAAELFARHLTLPVANVRAEQLVRTFDEARGSDRAHEAIDIMAPRGTAVYAVEDGRIAKLFWSNAGGRTIYQFDPSERFVYYYAHLDAYAEGLAEGQWIRRGQVIGQVGSTGNASANAPHLHFAIFQLTSTKRWWEGTAIDPYSILRWALDSGNTP